MTFDVSFKSKDGTKMVPLVVNPLGNLERHDCPIKQPQTTTTPPQQPTATRTCRCCGKIVSTEEYNNDKKYSIRYMLVGRTTNTRFVCPLCKKIKLMKGTMMCAHNDIKYSKDVSTCADCFERIIRDVQKEEEWLTAQEADKLIKRLRENEHYRTEIDQDLVAEEEKREELR